MLIAQTSQQVSLPPKGTWIFPASFKWWERLPTEATPKTYSLKQRIFGPIRSSFGTELGLMGRLFYGWLYTDDPYFVRVDEELREKGL